MLQNNKWLLCALACLMFCITSAIAKPIQIELKDGTIWQGEIGQTITVILTNEENEMKFMGSSRTLEARTYKCTESLLI